jgi:hypothetical protein
MSSAGDVARLSNVSATGIWRNGRDMTPSVSQECCVSDSVQQRFVTRLETLAEHLSAI